MFKIIQIAVHDNKIYGLDINGALYYWGQKWNAYPFGPNDEGDTGEYIYGWKLMEDEINKI